MSKKIKKPELDPYEQELEDHMDEFIPTTGKEDETLDHTLKAAAHEHLKKDKRITIRVYSSDLERIKKLAAEEGLPYQTYITSILHKLSTGRLKNIQN